MVRPGTVCAKSAVEWTPASSREAEVTEEIATGTFCAFSARLFAVTTISSRCPSDADSAVATDCAEASDAKPSAPMHNISSTNLLVIFLSPTIGCMATMNRQHRVFEITQLRTPTLRPDSCCSMQRMGVQ